MLLDDLLVPYLAANPIKEAVPFYDFTDALYNTLTSLDHKTNEDPQRAALATVLTRGQDTPADEQGAKRNSLFIMLEESLLRQLATGTWAVDARVRIGPRHRPIEPTHRFQTDTEVGLSAGLLFILVYTAANDFIRDVLYTSQAAPTPMGEWDTWEYPRADLMDWMCSHPYIIHYFKQPRRMLEDAVEKYLMLLYMNNNITYYIDLRPLQAD